MTRAHDRGRRRRTRRGRLLVLAGVPFGLLGSGLLVWQASYAAFTGTTTNTASNLSTGTVVLDNTGSASALFTATLAKPGDSGYQCTTVKYTGTLPASGVKVYATSGSTDPNFLGTQVFFSIETFASGQVAAGGSLPAQTCDATNGTSTSTIFGGVTSTTTGPATSAKTLANFVALNSYSVGMPTAGAWAPAAQSSTAFAYQTYRIRYLLDPNASDTYQGKTVTNFRVSWEAQS